MDSVITIYKTKQQTITIKRSDITIDVPNDVLQWFIHNFNHWFDEYSFDELLLEFYPNHNNETPQKKAHNRNDFSTSIKSMINKQKDKNITKYVPNYDIGTSRYDVKQLNYTHSALIYIHMKS